MFAWKTNKFLGPKRFPLNKPLRILLFTNGLILVAGAMFIPLSAIFVEEVGGSILDAGFAGGVYALAAGITVLVAGKYSDRTKDNELIVAAGYVVMGIGFMSFLLVNNVWSLLLVQAIIGFGEAIYSPPFDAIYSKHLDNNHAGTQWGAWESMNYFTTTAGAVIGGAVVTFFGFKALFVAMAILAFFSAIFIFKLPRRLL
jgi:MFS family permease